MSDEYSLYGDTYSTRQKELGPFVELPDGSLPLWEIEVLRLKHHYGFTIDYWESPRYEHHEKTFVHFFKQIAARLASGRVDEAARFAGTMSHHIGDSGVPAHAADFGDLEVVKDYFPQPPDKVAFHLHSYTEQDPGQFLLNGYRPILFGRTPNEAASRFMDRYIGLTLYARKLLFPLARCAYENREREAQRLRRQAAEECARVLADFLYTATCMGLKRFSTADLRRLRVLQLTDRWPYRQTAWAPFPYFEPAPYMLRGTNLDSKRRPVPCRLYVRDGRGPLRIRTFREALGSGAFFEYHFRVPARTFTRLTGWVGIHASLGAQRPIQAEIRLNGRSVFRQMVWPGAPAIRFDLPARGCRNVQFIASGPILTDPDGSNNHVVWAEPRLIDER